MCRGCLSQYATFTGAYTGITNMSPKVIQSRNIPAANESENAAACVEKGRKI
jgi:hypothetical protein